MERSFDVTQAHRFPRPEDGHERHPLHYTSIIGPPEWSPLHEGHDVVSERGLRVGDGFGVGMFWHPGISHCRQLGRGYVSFSFHGWAMPYRPL